MKKQLMVTLLALSLALGISLTTAGAVENIGPASTAANNINNDSIGQREVPPMPAVYTIDNTNVGASNSTAAPQELRALTLEEALQLAGENNFSLQTAKYELDKKAIAAKQAAKQLKEVPEELDSSREMADALYNDKSKKFDLELARQSYELSRKKLEYTIKGNYYSALKSRDQIMQNGTTLELAEKELSNTNIAYSIGIAGNTEVQNAEAAVSSARARLTDAENAYRMAEFTMSSSLDLPAGTRYSLAGAANYQPPGEINLEAVIIVALYNRLDILEKEGKKELADMNYDIAAGFSAPNTYVARQAKASAEQADLTLRDTKEKIFSDITRTYQKLMETQKQLDINARALETSKQNYNFAKIRYDLGRISKMVWLTAAANLQKAESAWFGALYDYELARVNFELSKLVPAN